MNFDALYSKPQGIYIVLLTFIHSLLITCLYIYIIGPLILTLNSPTDTSYFDCFLDSTAEIPVFDNTVNTQKYRNDEKGNNNSPSSGASGDVIGGYECTDFTSFSFNNI